MVRKGSKKSKAKAKDKSNILLGQCFAAKDWEEIQRKKLQSVPKATHATVTPQQLQDPPKISRSDIKGVSFDEKTIKTERRSNLSGASKTTHGGVSIDSTSTGWDHNSEQSFGSRTSSHRQAPSGLNASESDPASLGDDQPGLDPNMSGQSLSDQNPFTFDKSGGPESTPLFRNLSTASASETDFLPNATGLTRDESTGFNSFSEPDDAWLTLEGDYRPSWSPTGSEWNRIIESANEIANDGGEVQDYQFEVRQLAASFGVSIKDIRSYIDLMLLQIAKDDGKDVKEEEDTKKGSKKGSSILKVLSYLRGKKTETTKTADDSDSESDDGLNDTDLLTFKGI